jgi:hypothetical protein
MPAEMPDVSFDRRDRSDAVPTASTGALPDDVPMPAAAATAAAPSALLASGRSEAPPATLSAGEAALIDHVRQHGGKAEVICIVRPHGAADASSEVFVLKGARPDFVDHLSRAHHGHAADAAHQPPQSRSDVAVLPTASPVR